MKKITTNIIKKVLGGGTAKQLFAINSILELQLGDLDSSIKKDLEVLSREEAEEIQKIKNKFSEKKSSLEDKTISKAIVLIAIKNKIVIEKKPEQSLEKIEEEKVLETERVETEELSEADRSMEEIVFNNSWNHNNN
ncbi:MAG: hypothetical protein M0P91_04505 [Sulfuricurvum sp.]|uniref:hypothetical protein n=1 Tax=Sulfuricurvum sp. TaxID=2025608 RepID=UPI0025F18227|nr:hypothetical protein [Sulfuricurvum sp.]MCK9372436.1 hypothetical protein [Sulfuricurvum sp.]